MSGARTPMHGRDHRGIDPATGVAGSDPARLRIDSTSNVGTDQGVGSHSATSGYVLTADGSGGSHWAASSGGLATVEILSATASSITAGTTNAVYHWSHVSGATLISFSGGIDYTCLVGSGYYSWMITCVTGENVNVGRQVQSQLQISAGGSPPGVSQAYTSDSTTADLGIMDLSSSLYFGSAWNFQMNCTNFDSITHNFTAYIAFMKLV